MTRLKFTVAGTPGPQGSKRNLGRGRMVESSKKVKPWRAAVVTAAQSAMLASDEWDTATGAVGVEVTFRLARPLDHYGTGRNAHQLKTWAPTYCTSQHNGDGDKLERATYDALTEAGVIKDDSLIVAGHWLKRYANHGEQAGATIEVYAVHDAPILAPYRYGQAVTS